MKIYYFIFYLLLLFIGCQDNIINPTEDSTFGIYLLNDRTLNIQDIQNLSINELKLESKPWLASTDIDFYDYSSHCIYLKKDKSELFTKEVDIKMNDQPFVLIANNIRCYIGSFHSGLLSIAPTKPYVDELDIYFSPTDVLHISKAWEDEIDMRNNKNIEYDLSPKNKLHKGLSIFIKDIKIVSNSDTATVQYTYAITNNDKDNLYVLDPDKMGSELFHYFTNGIDFWSNDRYISSQYKSIKQPEPFDSWEPEWFTKIESASTIERTVLLKGYPHIPDGVYKCMLNFSNPNKIQKIDRELSDGRYWLGDILTQTQINVGG
jgi:hypothetical protein